MIEPFLERILAWVPDHLERIGRILLVLALAALALHYIRRFVPRLHEAILSKQASPDYSRRFMTLSQVAHYALTVVVLVVTAVLILAELGISVAPILGAAGVVGIAIGFGAQSLVKDYFTGFFLLLENQIRLGDVVEAGGRYGVVEEMTLRYLKLRDHAGSVHYVPNSTITVVTNMTVGFAFALADIRVAFGQDIERAVAMMQAVGREMRQDAAFAERILDDLEIDGVDSWAENATVLRCRFKTTPGEQWGVRREFLKRIKLAFDGQGIATPAAQPPVGPTPGQAARP